MHIPRSCLTATSVADRLATNEQIVTAGFAVCEMNLELAQPGLATRHNENPNAIDDTANRSTEPIADILKSNRIIGNTVEQIGQGLDLVPGVLDRLGGASLGILKSRFQLGLACL